MLENERRGMLIGRVEPDRARLVELEPIVELVENDGTRGRRRRGAVAFEQCRIPTRPIDTPTLAGGVLPALQAADKASVTGRPDRLQPGFELGRMLGPVHPAPTLAGGKPLRKMVENEGPKHRLAARIEPGSPKPGETGKQGIAAKAFQVVAQAAIVGLALEQLLDGFTQLLFVHRVLHPVARDKGVDRATLAEEIRQNLSASWPLPRASCRPCPNRHTPHPGSARPHRDARGRCPATVS